MAIDLRDVEHPRMGSMEVRAFLQLVDYAGESACPADLVTQKRVSLSSAELAQLYTNRRDPGCSADRRSGQTGRGQ